MRIADAHGADRRPDAVSVVHATSAPPLRHEDFVIRRIELRLYAGRPGEDRRGAHSLVTSYVETDKGSVEMTYDEGFLGDAPLESATRLLAEHLGLSALVLRSVIALRGTDQNC